MIRSLIGDKSFHDFISNRIGKGALILLGYGPGSGGDILLKDLLKGAPPSSNGIYLSTYETVDEIVSYLGDDHRQNIEVRSAIEQKDGLIDRTLRRDRFITDGIMVTDLLEVSMSDRPMEDRKNKRNILSYISSSSSKQFLPFTLVLDSLDDLLDEYDRNDISTRLLILKKALRTIGGIAVFGASLDSTLLNVREIRIFDCLMEAEAILEDNGWSRKLRIVHRRNDPLLPTEWELKIS